MNSDHSNLIKLDKVFPHLHEADEFKLSYCIPPDIEFEENGFSCLAESEVANLLTRYGYAIVTGTYPDQFAKLTQKGREAKAAGGHFEYLKQQAYKKQKDQKRQHTKELIDHFELLMKKWTYKSRYLPYIVSILAFAFSIYTHFNTPKETKDLELLKQEIQQMEAKTKSLDSFLQTNSSLKKDTLLNQ